MTNAHFFISSSIADVIAFTPVRSVVQAPAQRALNEDREGLRPFLRLL